MILVNLEEIQNTFFDTILTDVENVKGLDLIYFIDESGQIIREKNFTETNNYLDQMMEIIKDNPFLNDISTSIYDSPFKTCTLLSDKGLIIISYVNSSPNLYMVIVGGEKEPVDLINLLKLVKESFEKIKG